LTSISAIAIVMLVQSVSPRSLEPTQASMGGFAGLGAGWWDRASGASGASRAGPIDRVSCHVLGPRAPDDRVVIALPGVQPCWCCRLQPIAVAAP
jgi:hypothetical protein